MLKKQIICLLVFLASTSKAATSGWEVAGSEDGVHLYRREIQGSDVVAFKGDGVVEFPIHRILSVVLDQARMPEWVRNLDSSKIIRQLSPTEYLEYDHVGTPIVMKDRDFLVHCKLSPDRIMKTFAIDCESTTDPQIPETKYVRGKINSHFLLTSIDKATKTRIEAEIHADPMGSTPKWIINFFQKSWPLKTFHSLRRQAKKSDIQAPSAFKALIESTRSWN